MLFGVMYCSNGAELPCSEGRGKAGIYLGISYVDEMEVEVML